MMKKWNECTLEQRIERLRYMLAGFVLLLFGLIAMEAADENWVLRFLGFFVGVFGCYHLAKCKR